MLPARIAGRTNRVKGRTALLVTVELREFFTKTSWGLEGEWRDDTTGVLNCKRVLL
jgi:hypothetical protein